MQTLSLLIKPASSGCNMRCAYCFYADLASRRSVRNYGFMSPETREDLISKCLAEVATLCTFGFQGGEPTLAGLDFFRRFVELEKQYNVNNAEIRHTLQTNGLAIDADWAAFLAENRFLVGLSIDAGKRLHDSLRPDAQGRATHRRCQEAADLFRRHGVEFNVLSVVTREMAAHPDTTYRFYRERGYRHIQFIPCIEGLGDGEGRRPHSLTGAGYGKFLCRIFDLWYRDFCANEYVSIRQFDNWVHMAGGFPPENCAAAGVCQPYMLVEGDGSVFPCDFYAGDEHLLGNVRTDDIAEMLEGEKAKAFIRASEHVADECRECEFHAMCRGGCRRDREPAVNGKPGLNVHCEAYRMFFAHALPRMREIARRLFS